jgi:hypothetical protein
LNQDLKDALNNLSQQLDVLILKNSMKKKKKINNAEQKEKI